MDEPTCRACGASSGSVVLDLGLQPACDYFPAQDDPGPDPVYPLQMWLCASCGLAQLVADPTVPEEPRATEPAALVAQAQDAVRRVGSAHLLPKGGRVIEFGSPHGGSWLDLVVSRGMKPAADGELAEVVLDCFGLMHAAEQSAALRERADLVAPGGVLLLQYHSLATIIRLGQWNALRHGHFAYYSTTALINMLRDVGFGASTAWTFDLYGGTVLLAARRTSEGEGEPDAAVMALLQEERGVGVTNPDVLAGLQNDALRRSEHLHRALVAERAAGRRVLGYGAASRAVTLLARAGVDRTLLPAVADASSAKQGQRMPGTDIPIVAPSHLVEDSPDSVMLFLPDLLDEVRTAWPEVEARGGHWIDADSLES